MTSYYIFFTIVFLIALIADKKKETRKKPYLYAMATLMTLFQGLRWNTGADWCQYLQLFDELEWSNVFSFYRDEMRALEPGYGLLNVLIKTFFGHYTFFLLITCGFINFTYAHFINKYIHQNKAWCYFLLLFFIALFPVRNTLAGVIFVWGIPYIAKRNFKKFVIVCIAAMSIHYSSVIGVLLYLFYKKLNKNIIIGIYTVTMVLATYINYVLSWVFSLPVLNQLTFASVAQYFIEKESMGNDSSSNLVVFIGFGVMLYLCLCYRDVQEEYDKSIINILANLATITLILEQMSRTGMVVAELTRITYFCALGFPVLLTLSLFYYAKRFRKSRGLVISFLFVLSLYNFTKVERDFYSDLMVPYYHVFEQSPVRDSFGSFFGSY